MRNKLSLMFYIAQIQYCNTVKENCRVRSAVVFCCIPLYSVVFRCIPLLSVVFQFSVGRTRSGWPACEGSLVLIRMGADALHLRVRKNISRCGKRKDPNILFGLQDRLRNCWILWINKQQIDFLEEEKQLHNDKEHFYKREEESFLE